MDSRTQAWEQAGFAAPADEQAWLACPLTRIPLAGLDATQRLISRDRLHHAGEPVPAWVVQWGCGYWVIDGHCRVARAIDRGQGSAEVRLMRLGPAELVPTPRWAPWAWANLT